MLKIAWHKSYPHPVPKGHRFPMQKYSLLKDQLLHQGVVNDDQFFTPGILSDKAAELVHDPVYLQKLKGLSLTRREEKVTGFEHSNQLIEREYRLAEGTRMAVDYAVEFGVAANIAGGTHHAFSDKGEGFCLLNDLAIAAAYAIHHLKMKNVLIVDLDVHQGNGTAQIFENTNEVFTFSMHGADNYPLKKQKSSLDLALTTGSGDDVFISNLNQALNHIENEITNIDLILYQSGVDVLESDKLGKLSLSQDGVKRRDFSVLSFAQEREIPIVTTMGGGYGENIKAILEAHTSQFIQIQHIFF